MLAILLREHEEYEQADDVVRGELTQLFLSGFAIGDIGAELLASSSRAMTP